MRFHAFLLAAILAASIAIAHAASPQSPAKSRKVPQSPMDPLSSEELSTAVTVLKTAGHVNEATQFPLLTLQEPPKAEVLKSRPGDTRHAFAIVKQDSRTFEALVDLSARKVDSWREIQGVQPGLMVGEIDIINQVVKADRGWQAAMRKRNIRNFDKIECLEFSTGYFAVAAEEGHRLVRAECFDAAALNFWGRPIEGLIAVVDINSRRVTQLVDTGVVPIPKAPGDYSKKAISKTRAPINPIVVQQPNGPAFKVNGSGVEWQSWSFHVRMDPHVGIVVSTVRFSDAGKSRSIMYEGHLSEIFVPYMDPSPGWYFRTYMDAGEYGAGKLASTLQPGADCPANAYYFNDWLADDHGVPQARERIACLFEREAGGIAWRHFDFVTGQTESRPARELVLRWIATVGNYDYIFDWTFQQNGAIRIAVGSTGIDEVKAVSARNYAGDRNDDAAYGSFVADHTVAVNHDHFFCFKLDMDIDGTRNSFETEQLRKVRAGKDSLRTSFWVAEPKVAEVESQAKLNDDMHQPAIWRIINPDETNALGYPVGYELVPGHDATDMLDPDDYPRRRAGFADYQLWVTPYTNEFAAAGPYPNQSKGGDGLPAWTRQNRSIENTDIVLWYTIGFHHVPRPEDWPVLPTMWHEFQLRPSGFFSHNPVLDLPSLK